MTAIHALDAASAPLLTGSAAGTSLDELLREHGRARWSGPEEATFRRLRAEVSFGPGSPAEEREAWQRLLALVLPARGGARCPSWLASEGEQRQVTPPDEVRELLALLDREPGALEGVVSAAAEAGLEREGEALAGLVDFLRRAALGGWWLLALEPV